MPEPPKLIRIDLSETEIPQPCTTHQRRGVQGDCDDCANTEPQPGEIPGLKGLWVEIRNPLLIPWGEKKQLFAIAENETVIGYKERLARGLIVAWNVPDAETGEQLPPTVEGQIDRVIDVVNPVYRKVAELNREAAVPKASATS